MKQYAHIAFEGPIAAGKTTLASMMSEHVSGLLFLEDFQNNDFLPDFYRDHDRWALPMQLWFLRARFDQLKSIPSDPSSSIFVDYSYLKNGMFSRVLLKGRELQLYQQISRQFTANIRPPDVVVYLDATNAVLLDRIRRRGRPYEQNIDETYLDTLRNAYDQEFVTRADLNMVSFDTSQLDLQSEKMMTEFYEHVLSATR